MFNDPEIVNLLKSRFVCAGIAHNGAGRRKDAEGEFANKFIGSGGTLQGLHVVGPSGELVAYVYDFRSEPVLKMLQKALKDYKPVEAPPIDFSKKDPRYALPEGATVVDVTTKVMGGYGPARKDESTVRGRMEKAWTSSLGREHLWIRKDEADAIARGTLPESLKKRIVRHHLVDNTRGTPTPWRDAEIKKSDLALKDGRLAGPVHVETESGDRGFQGDLLGFVEAKEGRLTRFDLVARGEFWGEGKHTPGAPKGKFPMAWSFRLSDPTDILYTLVPDAIRGYSDYLQ